MALSDSELSAAEAKLSTELADTNFDFRVQSIKQRDGTEKTFRPINDMMSLLTITKNQIRSNERDQRGICSRAEIDFD